MLLEGASGGRPTVQLGSARVVCRLPASERWFPPDTAKPKLQILEKREGRYLGQRNERTNAPPLTFRRQGSLVSYEI